MLSTPYDQGSLATRGGGAPPSSPARRYIGECAQSLESALTPLMAALFDKVDDALYDLADKSPSNGLYTVYFDGMRIIRKQHRSIQLNFLRLLREGADNVAAGLLKRSPSPSLESGSQDFGLIQDAELEEILAIDNLVSKADSRYRRDLMEMNHYLGGLLDRDSFDGRSNPFGPSAICEAFRGALNTAQQLEPPIRLVLYKLFDKNVTDRLGDFYAGCVKLALAGGHRPGSGFAYLLHRGTGAEPPPDAGSDATAPNRRQTPELRETPSLPFEKFQELLGRQRPADAGRAGSRHGGAPLETSELLAVLSSLDSIAVGQGALSPGSLRANLSAILESQAGETRDLARKDQDTLDLVFMFFEHLLQGNGLPDPIKVLIGRMQIPVAKLALLDKGFFSEQGHPARQLINHIGEAAVGWSDDDRGPDSLYGMIERVVERLILDFDGDPGLFARLDRYFVAFIAREQARARAAEAQSVARLATRMPDSEQRAVTAALEACMARYPQVPPAVETMLREGWQPAMLAAYRSDRTESGAWRAGLELADRLLWSVQPKTDLEDRRQLLRWIPDKIGRAHV